MTSKRTLRTSSQLRKFLWFALSVVAGGMLLGLLQQPVSAEPGSLRVGGSWSGYRSLSQIAEEFTKSSGAPVTVQGTNNKRGFRYLADDKLQVLVYSPQTEGSQESLIREAFGEDDQENNAKLRRHLFGQFVVVVIVHPDNPVRTLSYDHLRQVFTGQAAHWKSVDGGLRAILPVGEQRNTKAAEIFRSNIMGGRSFVRGMQQFETADQVAAFVAQNPGAIGFCLDPQANLGNVTKLGVARSAEGPFVPPRLDRILARQYPLTEDLLLYTRVDGPTVGEDFCEYACGPEGAKIAREHFLYPGQDRVRYEARDRFALVKAGTAPRAKCVGIREGRAMMQNLANSFVLNKGAIDVVYQESAAASQTISLTEDVELTLLGTTGVGTNEGGMVLGHRTLGVIVHPENSVGELLVSDLKTIYEGSLSSWPGQEGSLQMVGPDSSSILAEVFRSLIGAERRGVQYTAKDSTQEIIRTVARSKSAIGIIDLAEFPAEENSVRLAPITIAGEKALPIVQGGPLPAGYPLARTYTLHISPTASRETQEFVRYLTPPRVKEILASHKLLPPQEEAAEE